MRKGFLSAIAVSIFFSGCLKSKHTEGLACMYNACATVAPASEIQAVQNYLTSNNITAVQHCSGVFYVIDTPGTGVQPSSCSSVNVIYKGRLTNGNVFDPGPSFPQPYPLTSLIKGWTNTIPLIKAGGKIHLYIPPSLGYGNQQVGNIPPNSILIFDVELTTVQ